MTIEFEDGEWQLVVIASGNSTICGERQTIGYIRYDSENQVEFDTEIILGFSVCRYNSLFQ